MQVNTYISSKDYETLSNNLPAGCDTVSQLMARVVREHANKIRQDIKEKHVHPGLSTTINPILINDTYRSKPDSKDVNVAVEGCEGDQERYAKERAP